MTVRLSITRDEANENDVMFTAWWDNLFIYYDTTRGRAWSQVADDLKSEWNARIIYQSEERSLFGSHGAVEAIEFDDAGTAAAFVLRWS